MSPNLTNVMTIDSLATMEDYGSQHHHHQEEEEEEEEAAAVKKRVSVCIA